MSPFPQPSEHSHLQQDDAIEQVHDLTLGQVADALVGVESSEMLLHRLEQLLGRLAALPARLWLIDTAHMQFYCVAGFACSREVSDLPAEDILLEPPAGHHLLHHHGDPVGLLQVETRDYQGIPLEWLAAILGPTLMGINNHEQTLRELRHMHRQSDRLIAAGRLLQHLDVEVLLTEIMQCVLETVDADVGAILVTDGQEPLQVAVAWGLRDEHIDGIQTRSGERLVDAVLEGGQNLRLHGSKLRQEVRFQLADADLRGIMALPLISSDRKHGVVLLANPQHSFSSDDERLVTVVCDMATIALDNLQLVKDKVASERIQRDMEVAKQVQARMLPDGDLRVPGLLAAGLSLPSEETGGDYYTWMQRDERVVAVIGDVTGHGLGAALFTTAAHSMVQYQFRNSRDLAHSLEALNQGLYHMRSGRFMTCAAVEIDPETLAFNYASAGHNPLCWIHKGAIRWLESSGTPLGIMQRSQVSAAPTQYMAPGDLLLLYTDGITEAFNASGDWWGEDAMAETLLDCYHRGLTGQEVIAELMRRMRGHTNDHPLGDDITLVVLSALSPDSPVLPEASL